MRGGFRANIAFFPLRFSVCVRETAVRALSLVRTLCCPVFTKTYLQAALSAAATEHSVGA